MRDGQRVACRVAQLSWDRHGRRWQATFVIQPDGRAPAAHAAADSQLDSQAGSQLDSQLEVLLALYTPRGLYVYTHDGSLGLGSRGAVGGGGSQVRLSGPRCASTGSNCLCPSCHRPYSPYSPYSAHAAHTAPTAHNGPCSSEPRADRERSHTRRGEAGWEAALDGSILPRLGRSGCERVAFVDFAGWDG